MTPTETRQRGSSLRVSVLFNQFIPSEAQATYQRMLRKSKALYSQIPFATCVRDTTCNLLEIFPLTDDGEISRVEIEETVLSLLP